MPGSSALIARFRKWYMRPIDLPGTYYLEVVQWLYKDNQLATGRFEALGRAVAQEDPVATHEPGDTQAARRLTRGSVVMHPELLR